MYVYLQYMLSLDALRSFSRRPSCYYCTMPGCLAAFTPNHARRDRRLTTRLRVRPLWVLLATDCVDGASLVPTLTMPKINRRANRTHTGVGVFFFPIRTNVYIYMCMQSAPPARPSLPSMSSPNVQAKHTCQYVGGFLTSAGEEGSPVGSSGDGGAVTLKAMVAGDVEECADLFVATHGKGRGWDRRGNIELCLGSGNPFPM